jgi:hypothetical protein
MWQIPVDYLVNLSYFCRAPENPIFMPVIKVIGSIKIYIYFFDHSPPHFHAISGDYKEIILIQTLETYAGKLPVKDRKRVIEWASKHKEYLWKKWKEYNPE